MDTTSLEWLDGINSKYKQVTLPTGILFDREEIVAALESGAVVVLDADFNLAFTCISLERLARVRQVGDTIIWPNGKASTILGIEFN